MEMKFWKELLPFLKNSVPLRIMTAIFFLIGIQEIMESNYKCPFSILLRKVYITLYFIIPCIIVFILGCYCQVNCSKSSTESWCVKQQSYYCALFFALLWVVILLLEGKYVACFCSQVEGNGTTQIALEGSTVDVYSKIAGLILCFIVAVIAVVKVSCDRNTEESSSEKVFKWEVEGTVSHLLLPEDSRSENRKDLSFCGVVKSSSYNNEGPNVEDKQQVTSAADIEMGERHDSTPSTSS